MNQSGIEPVGNRIVVLPDEIEEVTAGGIIIPAPEAQKHQSAQAIGTLVAVGPDAFSHEIESTYRVDDMGNRKLVQVKVCGYHHAWAEPGDRIAFAKYAGLQVEGEDGKQYRILNDKDITAIVSENVNFTDIKSRKALGVANG